MISWGAYIDGSSLHTLAATYSRPAPQEQQPQSCPLGAVQEKHDELERTITQLQAAAAAASLPDYLQQAAALHETLRQVRPLAGALEAASSSWSPANKEEEGKAPASSLAKIAERLTLRVQLHEKAGQREMAAAVTGLLKEAQDAQAAVDECVVVVVCGWWWWGR